LISKEDVDVIICSDCIYDEDLVEILAKTIAALARPDTGAHLCFFRP
jgi:predicted nicotinamide N-methyase